MAARRSAKTRDSWVRFFILTFGNQKRFNRFMIALVVLLTFVVVMGCVSGGAGVSILAAVSGVWGVLRRFFRW